MKDQEVSAIESRYYSLSILSYHIPDTIAAGRSLMGKYPVYHADLFAWLLKEVNVFLGPSAIAHHFSAWGMNQALQQAAKMSANAKSKKAKDDIAQYLAANKDLFRSGNDSNQTM